MKTKTTLLSLFAAATLTNAAQAITLQVELPTELASETTVSIYADLYWQGECLTAGSALCHNGRSLSGIQLKDFPIVMSHLASELLDDVSGSLQHDPVTGRHSVLDFAINDGKHALCHVVLDKVRSAVSIRWNANGQCIVSMS